MTTTATVSFLPPYPLQPIKLTGAAIIDRVIEGVNDKTGKRVTVPLTSVQIVTWD